MKEHFPVFSFLLTSSKDSKEYALHDDTVAACMFSKCPGTVMVYSNKSFPNQYLALPRAMRSFSTWF